MLVNKKDKEEPQKEILIKLLSNKVEELNLKEDFKIKKLIKSGHSNDVFLVSNTDIN